MRPATHSYPDYGKENSTNNREIVMHAQIQEMSRFHVQMNMHMSTTKILNCLGSYYIMHYPL